MNVSYFDYLTDDYNCTTNENNIDIIIPTLLLTIPSVYQFLMNIPHGIYFN